MPEETLKYKVELDAADLAPQLESLRQQIDVAMGASAMQATPVGGMSGFMQAANTLQGGFMPPTAASFNMAPTAMQAESLVSATAAWMDQSVERAQLGFGKFMDDARRFGLTSPMRTPEFSAPLSPAQAQVADSFLGQVSATALGTGYDPRGPLSMGSYREMSQESATKTATDFVLRAPGFIAGTAAGAAVGGIPGAAVGFAAGLTSDVILNTIGARTKEQWQVGEGLKAIAEQTIGTTSTASANQWAGELQNRAYSYESRINDFSMQDIQETVMTFGNAGGFQGSQSMGELKQRTKDVLDNVRTVAHTLGTFQEEAAAIMGDLQQRGVTSTANMGAFAATQQSMGAQVGMTGMDFIQYGLQGAEMFRGSGIGMQNGFNVMQQARLNTEFMMSDPYSKNLISDMGGANSAAVAMAENATRHMTGGMGLMQSMSVLGGGSLISQGYMQDMAGAADFIAQDPANLLRARVFQPDVIAAQIQHGGTLGLQANTTNKYMDLMKTMGIGIGRDGKIDAAVLAGLVMEGEDMSRNEALLMVKQVAAGPEAMRDAEAAAFSGSLDALENESMVSVWRGFKAGVGHLAGEAWVGSGFPALGGAILNTAVDPVKNVMQGAGDWLRGRDRQKGKIITSADIVEEARNMTFQEVSDDEVSAFYINKGKDAMSETDKNLNYEVLRGDEELYSVLGRQLIGKTESQQEGIVSEMTRMVQRRGGDEVKKQIAITSQIDRAIGADLSTEGSTEKRVIDGEWHSTVDGRTAFDKISIPQLSSERNRSISKYADIASQTIYKKDFSSLSSVETITVNTVLGKKGFNTKDAPRGVAASDLDGQIVAGARALRIASKEEGKAVGAFMVDLRKALGSYIDDQGFLGESGDDRDEDEAMIHIMDIYRTAVEEGTDPLEAMRTHYDTIEDGGRIGELLVNKSSAQERKLVSIAINKLDEKGGTGESAMKASKKQTTIDLALTLKKEVAEDRTKIDYGSLSSAEQESYDRGSLYNALKTDVEGSDSFIAATGTDKEDVMRILKAATGGGMGKRAYQDLMMIGGQIDTTALQKNGAISSLQKELMDSAMDDPAAMARGSFQKLQAIAGAVKDNVMQVKIIE